MGKPKLLLVDDDAEDRLIILDALEHLHADDMVHCAENGEMALKLLDEFASSGHYPCLVVLDLNMPRMNGTETLKTLKSDPRYKDITVVIYSTSVNLLEKEACMQLGAKMFITKPLSYKESLETAKLFLSMCGVPAFA